MAHANRILNKLCRHCTGIYETIDKDDKYCPLHKHLLENLGHTQCPICKGPILSLTHRGCLNGKTIYHPMDPRRRCANNETKKIIFPNDESFFMAESMTNIECRRALLAHSQKWAEINSPFEDEPQISPYPEPKDDNNPFKPWERGNS